MDSKNKNAKPLGNKPAELAVVQQPGGSYNQNFPLEMQQTFAMNIPMENSGDNQNDDEEPRQMDQN